MPRPSGSIFHPLVLIMHYPTYNFDPNNTSTHFYNIGNPSVHQVHTHRLDPQNTLMWDLYLRRERPYGLEEYPMKYPDNIKALHKDFSRRLLRLTHAKILLGV